MMTQGTTTHSKSAMVAAGLMLAAGLGACTGSQPKPDEKAQAKSAEAGQADSQKAKDDEIDVDRPSLSDDEPAVQKLGSAEGVTAWKVGSLKLIHKPTPANSVVSANLYLDGGVTRTTDETAGLQQLALRVATNGGTESTPKDVYNSTLSSMGSSVGYFTGRDYSGYSLKCIKKHFDKTWKLMTQAVLEPAMPQAELKVQRERQLASIAKMQEDPNQLVSNTTRKLMAEGHPYHRLEIGTKKTVESFDRRDVLEFHADLLRSAPMTLVVVGDISKDALLSKVKSSLGRLEQSDVGREEVPPLPDRETRLEAVKKDIPTNYILGAFRAPSPGDEDYAALKLATAYLSDELFKEIRTKRRLSYAVASGVSTHLGNHGYLYVTPRQPNKAMEVMLAEIEELKEKQLSPEQLERTRNVFMTEHYMDMETNSGQASALGNGELIAGDWRWEFKLRDAIKSVTPEDVQRVVKEYMTDYQFGVVGHPEALDRSVFGVKSEKAQK